MGRIRRKARRPLQFFVGGGELRFHSLALHPVVLTDDMVSAWRVFIAADAWGDYDGSDYAKAVYAAGWPKGW